MKDNNVEELEKRLRESMFCTLLNFEARTNNVQELHLARLVSLVIQGLET